MALVALAAMTLAASACGYRVAGQGSNLPQNLKVIAVPAFENRTTSMGLEQRLTDAVMREFIHRTRYRVVGVEEGADAALRGTVLTATTVPVLFDPATGRASAVLVTVTLSVEMRDLHTQQVLYTNSNYVFRDQYEITGDVNSFFEEREPALERLARDFGAALVSAVLENF
ncbi:MAG TPA: LPS assembly lipoprotein LptE [Candidatus Acidoferrales bacterium]|nr:LPS assembly lipoprotein LptE [Candidatus Acidoferrales bacterium]